jgi:hypothetical protein
LAKNSIKKVVMKTEQIETGGPGKNKIIPEKYKQIILTALSYYPELKDVSIEFKLIKHGSIPYSTKPAVTSLLKPRRKRTYMILLLEEANEPMNSALLRNLPEDEQVAVIAHELVHVLQFHACSIPQLLKTILTYPLPFFKKRMERGADIGAIEHLQGENLYKHAVHIRNIPGYTKQRPDINKYYLKPAEILHLLRKFKV